MEYKNKKNEILSIHNNILKHFDSNLSLIKSKLPQNYHLFLTDENFIITNTTFKYDKNFSLAFLKKVLKTHIKPHIGPPLCEPATTNFISFSDSYQNKRVFQVGYIFNSPKIEKFKNEIKNIKKQNPFIQNINLYFIHPKSNFAQKCSILNPIYKKYSLSQMKQHKIEGITLFKKLQKQNPIFQQNKMYILSKDIFNPNEYMIFEMTINQNFYLQQLTELKFILVSTIIFIILIIILIFIYLNKIILFIENFAKHIKEEKEFKKTLNNEIDIIINSYNNTLKKLQTSINSKEEFLQFAMHELKTPLSILSLNINDDDYLSKSALKKLTISYQDMLCFLGLKNNPKIESFNLKELLLQRVDYFKDITKIENKKIILDLEDACIYANKEMIERLIDNNISNAIKYSTTPHIYITLKNYILNFKNQGQIKNMDKLFEKFYREDNIKGGFGIGLNIIKNITTKYNIKITLSNNKLIKFQYDFKDIKC